MKLERIDKIIANQGTLSRKEVKTLIKNKQIKVDGNLVLKPEEKFNPSACEIIVAGEKLNFRKNIYLMLNKPKGVVSATKDPNTTTVVDLVPNEFFRSGLFPAGRLDRDTTGFLLITDDGDFAHNILSPKKHVEKTYLATVDGEITEDVISGFESGLLIDNGDLCKKAKIEVLESSKQQSIAKVMISEGMYHQIKRMFEMFELEVTDLKRTKMGELELDNSLKPGECRELAKEELEKIRKAK